MVFFLGLVLFFVVLPALWSAWMYRRPSSHVGKIRSDPQKHMLNDSKPSSALSYFGRWHGDAYADRPAWQEHRRRR